MTTSRFAKIAKDTVRWCPGCGKHTLEFNPDLIDNSGQPFNPVYDVLCRNCGWSGDISPDVPFGVAKYGDAS